MMHALLIGWRRGASACAVTVATTVATVGLGTAAAGAATDQRLSLHSHATQAPASAPYDEHLTRAPYLTDLVGTHVAINYATDRSASTGSIQYGPVSGSGGCSLSQTVASKRTGITVGAVAEYQWTAEVDLPAPGTYCYRIYLASADLLATNASPAFTTQAQAGTTTPFVFDVFGDWGQVDSKGANPDQANLLAQMAASNARFAISVGDNGYPNGSQTNYGDLQQTGASTSAIFGPSQWTVPGATLPIFTAAGNHGLSGTAHTDITTWTESHAVSDSGGRYQNDVYCCVNGTKSSNYASEWYAFDAGPARFYVLDSAWGDTNAGTATPYANDAAAHFAPGTPEYTWLVHDLQTHPSELKFAFSHYPFYADNPNQSSDTYLDGPKNLEGLLAGYGVQMVFNGHAHIYQRNVPSGPGMPITYVTGGGGATLEPIGPCSAHDAYGIGWSPTKLRGSACGAARSRTSAAQVYNFLQVQVAGSTVTVTPTDSLGDTFDTQTYTFAAPTQIYLDSTPPALSGSDTATFAFHSSDPSAQFTCQIDAEPAAPCTSPVTYSGLADGSHQFSVFLSNGGGRSPATYSWTTDTTAPDPPTGLTAATPTPVEVDLSWSPASDQNGIAGYRLYRDGQLAESLDNVTSATDTVSSGSTYQYTVSAVDNAGNESAPSDTVTVTTPSGAPPVFADGFESGDLSAWTSTHGLNVETGVVHTGTYAAEAATTDGNTYAKKTLPGSFTDAYARVAFDRVSASSQVNLLRLRDGGGASLGYLYVNTVGMLGYHNDALGTNVASSQQIGDGWHVLELHRTADTTAGTASGTVQVWLDGSPVASLSGSNIDVGVAPVGALQIGDVQSGRTYDVTYDDAAFGTTRLGVT